MDEGQNILRKYNIDPIIGIENIVWAPNRIAGQHNGNALNKVVEGLRKAEKLGASRDDVVDFLNKMGWLSKRR